MIRRIPFVIGWIYGAVMLAVVLLQPVLLHSLQNDFGSFDQDSVPPAVIAMQVLYLLGPAPMVAALVTFVALIVARAVVPRPEDDDAESAPPAPSSDSAGSVVFLDA